MLVAGWNAFCSWNTCKRNGRVASLLHRGPKRRTGTRITASGTVTDDIIQLHQTTIDYQPLGDMNPLTEILYWLCVRGTRNAAIPRHT